MQDIVNSDTYEVISMEEYLLKRRMINQTIQNREIERTKIREKFERSNTIELWEH